MPIILPYAHTHLFNGPFFGTTQVSRYQQGKTNLDFTAARVSEWQWHQLGHMQVCISPQTDNHASNPTLSFLQAGCPSCRPTNSVKALKARISPYICYIIQFSLIIADFGFHKEYDLQGLERCSGCMTNSDHDALYGQHQMHSSL